MSQTAALDLPLDDIRETCAGQPIGQTDFPISSRHEGRKP